MTAALRQPVTGEEFLAWEVRQEFRYEFDGVRPVAMTGGTRNHATIQANLAISIGSRLRGTPCRFFGSDLKVKANRSFRYPDGFIVCTQGAGASTVVPDPVVIFEVLSPSTAGTDQITKNREYAATPSVQRYVLLTQDRVGATVFARVGADWIGHVLDEDAALPVPEAGIELPLAELYDGVDLSGTDDVQDRSA